MFESASDMQREDLYQLFQVEIGCFEHDFIRDEVEDLFLDLDWEESLQQRNLVMLDYKIAGCGKRDYRISGYLELRETIMRRLGATEEAYWSVIQHLKRISKYPNGKQAAQDLARYWKEYHYNRPAMKDELRKAGF